MHEFANGLERVHGVVVKQEMGTRRKFLPDDETRPRRLSRGFENYQLAGSIGIKAKTTQDVAFQLMLSAIKFAIC